MNSPKAKSSANVEIRRLKIEQRLQLRQKLGIDAENPEDCNQDSQHGDKIKLDSPCENKDKCRAEAVDLVTNCTPSAIALQFEYTEKIKKFES